MKKVLILTITAGEGHNSTAKAVMNALQDNAIKCEIIDAYKYISPVLCNTVNSGYLVASKYSPKTYRRGYRLAERIEHPGYESKLLSEAQYAISKKLFHHIAENNYDCIVCTHIFAAKLINSMKLKGYFTDLCTIGIVTDFTIHPFWSEASRIDYILVASELLACEAKRKSISEDRLLPFGIPIDPKFSLKRDKKEARRLLGIDENKPTILVMGGSMGYGKMNKQIESLDALDLDIQILAVCGNNKAMKEAIDEIMISKKIYSYGFVNNVDELMNAADCIVTKPGGLTTSEALTKEIPMIIINPIPGQEDRNVEFLMNNQAALRVSETYPLTDALYQFFKYPEKIDSIRRSIAIINKPNASQTLADFIANLK